MWKSKAGIFLNALHRYSMMLPVDQVQVVIIFTSGTFHVGGLPYWTSSNISLVLLHQIKEKGGGRGDAMKNHASLRTESFLSTLLFCNQFLRKSLSGSESWKFIASDEWSTTVSFHPFTRGPEDFSFQDIQVQVFVWD